MGLVDVFGLVFVDAILSTSFGSVVVVVNSILANVVALVTIIALDVTLVVGSVSIVASILVDVSTHVLVGAMAVASDATISFLLADIVAVLVAFAVVSIATIATTGAVASDTTERTGGLFSVAAVTITSGTMASASSVMTSVNVSFVEGLEGSSALGKADVSRVGLVMLCSTSAIVTDLSVEMIDSSINRFVGKDLGTIASMTITAMTAVDAVASVAAIRLSAI